MKPTIGPSLHDDLWLKLLLAIIENSDVLNKIALEMPNVEFPTMGGEVFWNNLAESGGWRIQQNKVTRHCRILDPRRRSEVRQSR
jgi:hypothetical protein